MLILLLLAAAAAWIALSSHAGSDLFVRWGAAIAAQRLDADMQIGKSGGSLLDVLSIDGLHGVLRRSRLGFAAGPLRFTLKLREAIGRGLVIENLECPWIKIWGAPNPGWLADLPDLPPFQCQVVTPLPIGFDRVRLDRIEWVPVASGPVEVGITSFTIDPVAGASGTQPVSFGLFGRLKQMNLVTGGFTGELHTRRGTVSGRLTAKIAGIQLAALVKIAMQRDGISAEGSLSETGVDLASLSRWLSPLWKEHLPLAASGEVTGSGTWLFQPRLGFLGAFQGGIHGAQAVLTGLNIPLIELNAAWKYFDGKIYIADNKSFVLGFPARIGGSIGVSPGRRPDWNIETAVSDIPLEELVATLPWAVRYGYSVPDVTGMASLTARFDGGDPGILVNCSAQMMRRSGGIATSVVMLRYRHEGGQADRWDLESAWTAESVVPRSFSAITVDRAAIGRMLNPPLTVNFEGHGAQPSKLEARLGVSSAGGRAWQFSGHLDGNEWSDVTADPGSLPATFPQAFDLPGFLLPGM
ncbi:MAG TPA: hypothetical protein PKM25_09955 [Candidatus Ozemobacteraceae bacterium]|nr:hypothetical protein [Candidatus Ozemobacteraceae bacterium]